MKNITIFFLLSVSLCLFGNTILGSSSELKPLQIAKKEGFKKVQSNVCDIHLSFGSYGSGTPYKIIKRIKEFLDKRDDIKESFAWSWGKEGENDLCLILTAPKKTSHYYSELKKIIPEFSKQGYTNLKTKSGQTWSTTWPKEGPSMAH